MSTADLDKYCVGPLWVENKVHAELAARLATMGTGGFSNESLGPAASFVVTVELQDDPAKRQPMQLASLRDTVRRQFTKSSWWHVPEDASLEFVLEDVPLIMSDHGFISAIVTAWSEHLPLVLKPDHIWQLILQGITAFVDSDPEAARDRFVDFEGKQSLKVRRDCFVKGAPSNDWAGVVDEFAELINMKVKPGPQAVFGVRFSTTSRTEELCSGLSAMAMCKHFFDYSCQTMCGFPTITLLGSLNDWQKLRQDAERAILDLCHRENSGQGILNKFSKMVKGVLGFDFATFWLSALLPVLDQFVEAYNGRVDAVFWNSMIKLGGRKGSGGYTGYTGWFNVFFPLIQQCRNKWCVPYRDRADYVLAGLNDCWETDIFHKIDSSESPRKKLKKFQVQKSNKYPDGTVKVPMTWAYFDLEFPMEFVSGFVGYTQDPTTRAIMPVLSFYLLDKMASVKVEEKDYGHADTALDSLRIQLEAKKEADKKRVGPKSRTAN